MTSVEDVLREWLVLPVEVSRPQRGTMNEVFIVDSDRGRAVLRGHRQADRSAVEFEHVVMGVARAGGVPAPRILTTRSGDVVARWDGRWWSLLEWIDGDQPDRGSHTLEQAESMGAMLACVHDALEQVRPPPHTPPEAAATSETIRATDELLSVIGSLANRDDDEVAAIRWLTAQREWLSSEQPVLPPARAATQVIHGDYHDHNLVFDGGGVVGVLDWEKARGGDPGEEVVRALHLSFRLDPARSRAFVNGYRAHRTVTDDDLDRAATNYGYERDRSVWFFDELYRRGNERLRPLLNHGPFVPFATSWATVRPHL